MRFVQGEILYMRRVPTSSPPLRNNIAVVYAVVPHRSTKESNRVIPRRVKLLLSTLQH